MFTGANTRDIEIEDEVVIKALNRLLGKRGYRVIGRNDNIVFFKNGLSLKETAELPILSTEKISL